MKKTCECSRLLGRKSVNTSVMVGKIAIVFGTGNLQNFDVGNIKNKRSGYKVIDPCH